MSHFPRPVIFLTVLLFLQLFFPVIQCCLINSQHFFRTDIVKYIMNLAKNVSASICENINQSPYMPVNSIQILCIIHKNLHIGTSAHKYQIFAESFF